MANEPTLLERAARAAHAEHNDNRAARAVAADPNSDVWKSWLPVVRAVIAAIRDHAEAQQDVADWVSEYAESAQAAVAASKLGEVIAFLDALLAESEGGPA